MSDEHPAARAARPALRLVSESVSPTSHSDGGGPAAAPSHAELKSSADLRAESLRREATLFAAVRGPQADRETFSKAGSWDQGTPRGGSGMVAETPSVSELTTAELGERFSALSERSAQEGGSDSGPTPQALGEALTALQSNAPLSVHPELWPAVSMKLLAGVDPEAVGRWLVCLAPFLHRVSPDTRLDFVIPKVGCLAVTSHRTGTDVEWLSKGRRRSRRDLRVKGSLASVGKAIFAEKARGVRGTDGLGLLVALASAPISLGELANSRPALIDPLAFWKLAAVSVPVALGDQEALVVHRDPSRPDLTATIELNPGKPIRVSSETVRNPDALLEIPAAELFSWAVGSPLHGGGTSFLTEGTGEAEGIALRQIGRPVLPIRSQP